MSCVCVCVCLLYIYMHTDSTYERKTCDILSSLLLHQDLLIFFQKHSSNIPIISAKTFDSPVRTSSWGIIKHSNRLRENRQLRLPLSPSVALDKKNPKSLDITYFQWTFICPKEQTIKHMWKSSSFFVESIDENHLSVVLTFHGAESVSIIYIQKLCREQELTFPGLHLLSHECSVSFTFRVLGL